MKLKKINKSLNFILFGASGDLAQLKLFPSLYELALQKRFAKPFTITGFARSNMTEAAFRKHFEKSLKAHVDKGLYDQKVVDELLNNVYYHQGQYDDPDSYQSLAVKLKKIQGRRVYNLAYLAVPPKLFKTIAEQLDKAHAALGETELMMEKPFGEDYQSAKKLFQLINQHFDKENLYLIDHYLGKAAVQSILPLRYNNTVLNLLLKGEAIANIQISALETVGVEERVGYFDAVGIVKDMVQSHLLQVLALLTMSMPVHPDMNSIRREKGNIMSALKYSDVGCGAVVAQYKSYRQLEGVDSESKTPTFAAFRCSIDLTDWYQVPIYIRTGKSLSHKHTYIVIEFKKPPFQEANKKLEANRLIIELYPHEEIQIRLVNDVGEESEHGRNLLSQESLACMGDDCLPAYGRLILDALLGNKNSFLSIDEILASWHFIDALTNCIKKRKTPLVYYKDGSEGPKEQFELTKQDGFEWYDPDKL